MAGLFSGLRKVVLGRSRNVEDVIDEIEKDTSMNMLYDSFCDCDDDCDCGDDYDYDYDDCDDD